MQTYSKTDIIRATRSVSDSSFIGRLRKSTGLIIDLPTEAQWEYACRAGTTSCFNNGTDCTSGIKDDNYKEDNLETIAWYGGNWNWEGEKSSKKREVGSKKPNSWGLYDMHGQLWEYCLDWYGEYLPEDKTDPAGALKGNRRVSRGGSWHAWPALCRSANRHFERGKFLGQGFRICSHISPLIDESIQCIIISPGKGETGANVDLLKKVPEDIGDNPLYKTEKLILKRIKAGSFMMGSAPDETGRDDDENQRLTTITSDFFMGVFHVTQRQYELVMGSNPSTNKHSTYPVETVSWEDIRGGYWPVQPNQNEKPADTFCGKLSSLTNLRFDLPTEAQWEYSCRSGTTTAYYNNKNCLTDKSGENVKDPNLEPVAFYGGNWTWELETSNLGGRTVGQKLPNRWNLYDMLGMLWEYCRDWYGNYHGVSETDPTGPPEGIKKVCRGGNWHAWPAVCRSANRQKARGAFGGQGLRIICKSKGVPPKTMFIVVDLSGSEKSRLKTEFLSKEMPGLTTNNEYKTSLLVLRRIPAGTFMMGSPENEIGRYDDETLHQVTLTEDFFISTFLVTQKQWELIMGYNNSITKHPTIPVDNIDWEECTV